MANRSVAVTLTARVQGYVAGIKTAKAATKDLHDNLVEAAKKDTLGDLSMAATVAGGALVAAFGVAAMAAAKFDSQMSAVAAATNATAGEMDQMREAALRAGADTAYSATESAVAIEELAKAGVSTANILAGGLDGALALAAAGTLDVGKAAEIASSAMNQFGLSGAAVPHIADLLAAGAGKAQGSVEDLGMALNQSGLIANQMGLSIEETTGLLSAFAAAGLLGSDAGTSLKTMLLRLAAPTEKAQSLMNRLGIETFDASGEFVGAVKFAKELEEGLGGLTDEQRNAALATLFGSDATRAAAIAYNNGSKGIQSWINKTNDSNYAADVAAKKMDNLSGDVERLGGALETGLVKAGSSGNVVLRALTKSLTGVVDGFANLPGPVMGTATGLIGVVGVSLLAAGAFGTLAPKVMAARESLQGLGTIGSGLDRVLTRTAVVAGKLAGTLAVLQVASAVLGEDVSRSSRQMTLLEKDLVRYGKSGKNAGEVTKSLGKDLSKFGDDVQVFADDFWSSVGTGIADTVEGLTGLGDVMDDSGKHARQNIKELDNALAGLVSSGHQAEAEAAFNRLQKAAEKQGISLRELKKAFPEYFAALRGSAEASDKAAASAKTLARGLEAAVSAGQSLTDVFDELNGATIGFAEAEITAEEAVDAFTASLKDNGRTMDASTEKGRANKKALLDGIKAARDAAQAKYKETGSVSAARATYGRYISQLKASMRAAGLTERQIRALIRAYAKLPKSIRTTHTTHFRTVGRPPSFGGSSRTSFSSGYGSGGRRWGGVDYAARNGLLTPAHVAAGTRIRYAEPATGGEAYVPRLGIPQRSRQIVDVAASWYGGRVMWSGQPAAPAPSSGISERGFAAAVRAALQGVTVVMDGRAVGRIEGMRADLFYARPGG